MRCDDDLVVRYLIVDDSAGFLSSARRLLERQGITVAGVASNGADAVLRVEELQPDVVLVDIDLGGVVWTWPSGSAVSGPRRRGSS
jgi:DNA-binding NarL/FixJ family response regulator